MTELETEFQWIYKMVSALALARMDELATTRGFFEKREAQERHYRTQAALSRMTVLYSGNGGILDRSRFPNSYLSGTSKPSCNFSKRIYRSSVQEILIFREEESQ